MDIKRHKVVGSCLKKAREDAGMTQVDLAAKLGKPQSLISKLEHGDRALPLVEVYDYVEALGGDRKARTELVDTIYLQLREDGLLVPRD